MAGELDHEDTPAGPVVFEVGPRKRIKRPEAKFDTDLAVRKLQLRWNEHEPDHDRGNSNWNEQRKDIVSRPPVPLAVTLPEVHNYSEHKNGSDHPDHAAGKTRM